MTEGIPGTQTLLRGLSIIDAVANGAVDLPSLSKALRLSRSTTQRLASALVKARYLRAENDRYLLGSKLIELGYQAREQVSISTLAHPLLEKLAASTQDTVHLGVPEGQDVLYLDKISGQRGLEMRSRVGHRMPMALTGVGKALMLDMSEARWKELHMGGIASVNNRGTPRAWEVYCQEMHRYAKQGVALDFAENEVGIHCVAAPIRDASGGIVAAISVASAAQYMPEPRMHSLVPEVCKVAESISRTLGWQPRQMAELTS